MRLFRPLNLFLLLIFISPFLSAQKPNVNEKFIPAVVYKIKDGLPSEVVQDIIQDEEGFLWIATQEGLSRFDSSEFINFSKDKSDPYSMPGILAEDLVSMPGDKLWVSIYETGIAVFDKKTFQSKSFKNTQSHLFQLPNKNLFGIDKDQNNNIWLSLYGEGIYQWNTKESKFYKHLSSDENAWLTSKQTFEIIVDSKNRLWICTIDSKVFSYDINTGVAQEFNFSSGPNNSSSPVYGFVESPNGDIYAGGYSGVFKFNEEQSKFDHIINKKMIADFYGGERTTVRRLLVDSKNNLWIGTTKSLLLFSDNQLNRVNLYESGSTINPNWTTQAIIEDKVGNIWFATQGNGLVKVSSGWEKFKVYIGQNNESKEFRTGFQFKENIWLVHMSSLIDLYRYENNVLKLQKSIKPDLGTNSIRIDSIYQDDPDSIWISSLEGINKVDVQTGETSIVTNQQGEKLGAVRKFYRAKNKRFYFYLFTDKQMGYFDENDMFAYVIPSTDTNQINGGLVDQMSLGIDEKIWLATDYGIETFDMKTHQYGIVYKSINQQNVSSFYIDKNNQNVWVIADGGLKKLKWQDNELIETEEKFDKILPKIIFDKIHSYKNNKLIISTQDSGIIEINTKSLDYSVFTDKNGLPSNLTKEVLFPENNIMVVTDKGLAIYNNEYKEVSQSKPTIVIDSIKLSGQKIQNTKETQLILENNFGSLDIDVALLSFLNAEAIEFEYRLNGLNDQWINTDSEDKFSFLNLSGGTYEFKVRGRSNDGPWSNIESFSFEVKPPIWKSYWAYLLYSLIFLSLLYWFLYLYRRKILYELEITKQQSQKQIAKAASHAKSEFLARVSHEIRTPLNGVLGMGELMLDTNMDEEQRIYAESIMASGHHLLEIINDILDLSKIEAGKLELEHKKFDLLLIIDEILNVFMSQSKQKELIFTCIFDHEIDRLRIGDIIRVKQILFNLLSNAFKFTNQGEVCLRVTVDKKDCERVIFNVSDTGLGIDNDHAQELFEPFVQADTAITRKYGGTGLGLAIVKQLVEKMDGTIKAQSKKPKGSIFEARIKLALETNLEEKALIKSANNIALLIENENLMESVTSYLKILNIDHSKVISDKTTGVIVDAQSEIKKEFETELLKVKKTTIMVHFIGLNSNHIKDELLNQINVSKLTQPPITYAKLAKNFVYTDTNGFKEKPSIKKATISLKLLVVEDNAVNQQVSIEMLEKMGHIVDIVDNAEEALNRLNRNRYDLLLLDYHLPEMDGLSLVKVWDNVHKTPIIMVTADLTDNVLQKCLKLNIDNIVAKPFSQLQLSIAIDKAISKIL